MPDGLTRQATGAITALGLTLGGGAWRRISFNPIAVRTPLTMKALLSFAALAVTALALQGLPAKAQDSTSGSTSTSSSGSTSASTSRSGSSTTSGTSGNTQNQRTNQRVNSTTNNSIPITFNSADPAGAAGTNGTNGAGSGGSSTPGGSTGAPYYGQSDITVRTTPTVYAPPVSGGNPCTLAVSGGVSVIGWGAAAGGTFVDQDCADRQKIAMIHNAGYAKAAQELMCNDKATYLAFKGTTTPCNPRPQFDPPTPTQPIVQQQPQPLGPPPAQRVTIKDASNLPRCSRTITDNCYGG
jgi:hypothetical protein